MAEKKFRNKEKKKKKTVLVGIKNAMAKLCEKKKKYTEAIGRRKTVVAMVRLYEDKKSKKTEIWVNGKKVEDFFSIDELIKKTHDSLSDVSENYFISVFVKGGGINAQSEAIRLGIARALVKINPLLRGGLKSKGFLKRDPRSVERKKPGLKKARKAPTWVKR